ncbi:MAG: Sec-independent protein translocase protein TatB [Caldilineaceae bacterium]
MDGFFGIGIQELILIAIVALIVLGPERLPATFREIAKFIRQVRNLTNEFTQQFGDDFKALEDLDPRRILQRELASMDEEEQAQEKAAKGKAVTSKTTPATKTTTAKPTTAKSTTAKPTATSTTTAKATTKPATSTSTAKTANTTGPDEASATPGTGSVVVTAAGASEVAETVVTQTPSPEPQASETAAVTETENQIAPPSLTQAQQEQNEAQRSPVVVPPSIQSNGAPPKEAESTAAGDGLTTATIAANGAQDHPITKSE